MKKLIKTSDIYVAEELLETAYEKNNSEAIDFYTNLISAIKRAEKNEGIPLKKKYNINIRGEVTIIS